MGGVSSPGTEPMVVVSIPTEGETEEMASAIGMMSRKDTLLRVLS